MRKSRRIAELERRLSARGEQVAEADDRVRTIGDQKRRLQGRHDDLLRVVADHIASGTGREQLRTAMVGAGFRAELEYALLEVPECTRPVAAVAQEVTPA